MILFTPHTTFTRYMAPKRVLLIPLPLPSATMTFEHFNNNTTNTNNNMNIYGNSGTDGGSFGVYKLVTVGTSDKTIRVPSVLQMSKRSYRKAMVANLFFLKIEALASDSSFTTAHLISTIVTYFNFNTSPAENGVTVAADEIRPVVFHGGQPHRYWVPQSVRYRCCFRCSGLSIRKPLLFCIQFDVTGLRH